MSDPLDASSGMLRSEIEANLKLAQKETMQEVLEAVEEKFDSKMALLRDGAQAALNTSWQLTGDPRFGVEGFIPMSNRRFNDIEERLKQIDQRQDKKETDDAERRKVDDERFEEIRERQEYIKRAIEAVWRVLKPIVVLMGKIADWKVWFLLFVAAVIKWVPYPPLHRLFMWLQHLLLQHSK
jgi:hypothetical protein